MLGGKGGGRREELWEGVGKRKDDREKDRERNRNKI